MEGAEATEFREKCKELIEKENEKSIKEFLLEKCRKYCIEQMHVKDYGTLVVKNGFMNIKYYPNFYTIRLSEEEGPRIVEITYEDTAAYFKTYYYKYKRYSDAEVALTKFKE